MKAFLLWLILSSCRKASRLLELLGDLPVNLALTSILGFRAILEVEEWGETRQHLTIAIDEACIKLRGEFWFMLP